MTDRFLVRNDKQTVPELLMRLLSTIYNSIQLLLRYTKVISYDCNLRVKWVKLLVGQFVALYKFFSFQQTAHPGGGVCYFDIIVEVESAVSTSSWRRTLLIWCHCGSRVCMRWLLLWRYQGGRVCSSDIIMEAGSTHLTSSVETASGQRKVK